jgi:ATP-dependent DNA helicase PIF1
LITGPLVRVIANKANTPGKVIAFETIDQAIATGTQLPQATAFFAQPRDKLFPVVAFIPARFATGRQAKRTIIPTMEIKIENVKRDLYAARRVLPLILAWSMTIHKSQGQSLQRAKVDLAKVFADGKSPLDIACVCY